LMGICDYKATPLNLQKVGKRTGDGWSWTSDLEALISLRRS